MLCMQNCCVHIDIIYIMLRIISAEFCKSEKKIFLAGYPRGHLSRYSLHSAVSLWKVLQQVLVMRHLTNV